MGSLIRSLLVWLLVLAVPAHGAAVASMVRCGSNHPDAAAASPAQHAVAGHHAHAGMAAGAHDHAAPAKPAPDAQAGAAGATSADRAGPAQPAATADAHKCSACGSCCSAGAILTTLPGLAEPECASTVFDAVVASVDAFTADLPDRPPRAWLA